MGRMGREIFGSGNGALRIRVVGFAVDGVFLDFVTEGGGFGGVCSCFWLYPLISSPIFSFVLLFLTPSLSFQPCHPPLSTLIPFLEFQKPSRSATSARIDDLNHGIFSSTKIDGGVDIETK